MVLSRPNLAQQPTPFGIELAIFEVSVPFILIGGRGCLQSLEEMKNNFRMARMVLSIFI